MAGGYEPSGGENMANVVFSRKSAAPRGASDKDFGVVGAYSSERRAEQQAGGAGGGYGRRGGNSSGGIKFENLKNCVSCKIFFGNFEKIHFFVKIQNSRKKSLFFEK